MSDSESGNAVAKAPGDGYPAVAAFMAQDSDHESFIFRSFSKLAARRLLFMQSELMELEERQAQLDLEALSSTDGDLQYSMRNWKSFSEKAKCRDAEKIRMDLATEMCEKLDKYYDTLLQQRDVFRLERPSKTAVQALEMEALGKRSKLSGNERKMLDDPQDLLALNASIDKDPMSIFWRNHWPFPTKTLSDNEQSTISYFTTRSLTWMVNFCSLLIATTLLIGPIVALYFVTNPDASLAMVIIFIILFAVGVSIATGATRDSLFAATAAYAAVLVVFVSGNLGQGNEGR